RLSSPCSGEGVVALVGASCLEYWGSPSWRLGGRRYPIALRDPRQIFRIPENRPSSGAGHGLLEDLGALGVESRRQAAHSGQVATRPRQARHEPRLDGVPAKKTIGMVLVAALAAGVGGGPSGGRLGC